ncbi:MAG: hypothetical protein ACK4SZ_03625 [Allosphingosinicella sp.]|uniref:hypothetical protein n=1 Tax=Allosphingosinicella sp. TaxID=2823234 RepID=UPI0039224BC8
MVHEQRSAALRQEALDLITGSGMAALLERQFRRPMIVGSVALDLMTWRDIDIYVPLDRGERDRFVAVLPPIVAALGRTGYMPYRITYNDEWFRSRGDYGQGFYFGFRVVAPGGAEWKIDLWAWDPPVYEQKLSDFAALDERLRNADRALILRLKSEAQGLPGFRDRITSHDVYQFVLDEAGTTLGELEDYCAKRRRHGK